MAQKKKRKNLKKNDKEVLTNRREDKAIHRELHASVIAYYTIECITHVHTHRRYGKKKKETSIEDGLIIC